MEIPRVLVGGVRQLAAVALFTAVANGGDAPLAPSRYDVERFNTLAVDEAAAAGKAINLYFFGKTHQVLLEPSQVRSSRYREQAGTLHDLRTVYSTPTRNYKGQVVGDPDSIVRLTNTVNGLRGYVKSAEGWAFIEPLPTPATQGARRDSTSVEHRVYTEGDIDANFLGTCAEPVRVSPEEMGAVAIPGVAGNVHRAAGAVTSPAELRVFELAVDADVEFYSSYGDDSTAEIEATLNMIDGIFEAELGLTIEVVSINIWEAEPDPYTSTDSGTQLNELRSHWNNNNSGIARDAAHLFTGKELDGSTVGIAYVSVVCSTSVAYGLSQDLNSEVLMPLLVAHELGHNFGANHDSSGSSPRYIMYPSLGFTNLDEFSSLSESDIADHVDGVSCLELEGGGSNVSDPPSGGGGGGGGGGGPVDPLLLGVLGTIWLLKRRYALPAHDLESKINS